MDGRSILRRCSVVFLLAGGLVLAGYGFLVGQADLYRARDTAHLSSLMAKTGSVAHASQRREVERANRVLKTGAVLGELEIPRIGVNTLVLEGDDSSILRRGAGHIPGTARPNSPGGNIGIAAHRDTYFRPLRFIRPGDLIVLKTPVGNHRYRVQSTQVVEPTDIAVLDGTNHPMLTLVTCYPFYFIGPAPHRFVVRASEIAAK